MNYRTLRALAWIAVASLPFGAGAQTPFNLDVKSDGKDKAPVGGRSSVDLIRLEQGMPSIPLRNGGVMQGSEVVFLEGRTLRRGEDYAIDYASGNVYLMVPVRSGQSLRVHYRFDPGASRNGGTASFGAPGNVFSLSLAPGTSALLGLGVTERLQDGTVLSSNLYGVRTNFQFGSGKSTGLFLVGERKKVKAESLLDFQQDGAPVVEGKDQAVLQRVEAGAFSADYQSIGEKFAGFQAFKEAGYQDQEIGQLQKERGLKRFGLKVDKFGSKSLNVSHGYRQVKDQTGAIEWRTLGVETALFSLQWAGQKVDPQFGRFQDLGEADREWLAREKGLDRQAVDGKLNLKGGTGAFNQFKVEDTDGKTISRRSASIGLGPVKVGYFDQHVEQGFTRFGSLRDPEAGQWAREQGMRRQNYSLEFNPFKDPSAGFKYSTNQIRTDSGDFKATDVTLGGKGWSFGHMFRGADAGMAAIGNMAEPEIQGHIQSIGRMYDGKGMPIRGEDRNWFLQSAGIERSGYRMTFDPFKSVSLSLDQVDLKGKEDDGKIQRGRITGQNFSFGYRQQDIGEKFTEVGRLMEFERATVGTLPGLQRTDIDGTLQLDKNKKLSFTKMNADSLSGDAAREQFAYSDKGIQLNYNRRSVDNAFGSVNQLVDPERDLLTALRGFEQSDFSLKWQAYRGLNVEMLWNDAKSVELDQNRMLRSNSVSWQMDRFTQIGYYRLDQRNDDPSQLLFGNSIERFGIQRSFGRLGTVAYSQENRNFDGTQTQQPDSRSQTLAYETKITNSTAVRTEQTRTQFSNGEQENTSANTLSTEINKRTGVSVTDIHVDRDGDKPDERRRTYGFWFDFGKGIRFSWGYARQLNSLQNGAMQSNAGLTPGQIGDVKVDAANYQTNRWDNARNQSTGNVQLSTVKPIRLGPLQDFSFRVGANTLRDNNNWQYENNRYGANWRLGSNNFGYEYFSQMTPTGDRAIDRLFSFSTDQDPKRALRGSVSYKVRTLPNDQQIMVRNYNLTLRPMNGLEVSHQLVTNPEVAKGDAVLGSVTQGTRANTWKLDFTGSDSFKAGLSWQELINEQNKTMSRIGGVNFTLFANNASPLSLFYGVEQGDLNGERRTAHRYSLRFDQRPGPNQLFSLFVGNLSWQHSRPQDQRVQNWNVRLEYQLRFK